MEKGKKMMQSFPGFVKDTSDIEENALQSPLVLPAQNTRCSKSETLCLSKEQSHCSEDGWVLEWEICVFESVNYLDFYHKFNCAMKKSTEVFQSECQRKSQVSPGDVENDKDKDTEELDQPSPSLLREKGWKLRPVMVETALTRILLLTVPGT
ncbi:mCG53609 [Mus musculus]|jgi:hypothetical protein|nr:mCG53609 [Mus musculus]